MHNECLLARLPRNLKELVYVIMGNLCISTLFVTQNNKNVRSIYPSLYPDFLDNTLLRENSIQISPTQLKGKRGPKTCWELVRRAHIYSYDKSVFI